MDRQRLHDILKGICPNVYYRPPPTVVMKYPCIIFSDADIDTSYGDNRPYRQNWEHTIVVVDNTVDSEIVKKVAELPRCSFRNVYSADGLSHYAFNHS